MLASQLWRQMVETEHAQSEEMRGAVPPPDDHWRPYAAQFRADPRRSDDPLVNRLLELVAADQTVMDVGAGGGRLALPLALQCRSVVAVEPSASMGAVLSQQAEEYGINNVSLVQSQWEEAEVDPADVVLCAHVVYTVRDIAAFLRKLGAHANRLVLIVIYNAPPQSQIYPLWQQVHGTKRLPLPSLPELLEVLRELEISPNIDTLPDQNSRGFDSFEQAVEQLSRRLYLATASPEAQRLEKLLPEILTERDGVLVIERAEPLRPTLVSWSPSK